MIRIGFGHFWHRWRNEWLWWWCHAQQYIWEFIVSRSCLIPVGHWWKWFLCCCFFGHGTLIHYQPSTVLHFDIVVFIFLNWAAAVLCISCWLCVRNCLHECLVCLHCLFLLFQFCFLQFATVTLCLIGCMRLICGWSTIFKMGVCLMCCHLIGRKLLYVELQRERFSEEVA